MQRPSSSVMLGVAVAAALLLPARLAAQDAPQPETPTAAPAAEDKEFVTLDVSGVPLDDVLRYFGQYYDLNVSPPPNASQYKVSVRFSKVPVMEALQAIVKQFGFVVVRSGSIIEIVRKEEAQPRKSYDAPGAVTDTGLAIRDTEIRIFEIRHARGQDVEKLIQGLITKIGYIAFDEKNGKLLVRDIPEVLEKIVKVVEQIDVPRAEAAGTAQQPATIKVVRLRFTETAALKKVIDKVAKPENVEVEEEASTKSYVLRGFPENIAAVERMIQTLDQKTQQVRIRVRVVETTLGNDEKLGINWTMRLRTSGSSRPWSFPFDARAPASWVFYPTPNPASQIVAGGAGAGQSLAGFAPGDSMPQVLSNQFALGILDATGFSAILEAIRSDTSSNLVAAPQLTTLDNKQADINLGQKLPVPIFTNLLNTQTGTTFPTITGFEEIETGVTMRVTPRIGADDYITLDVAPELSEITGFVGANQERPILSQRRMKTTVVLKSGATLALGGLNFVRKSETVNKVPFLGEIPLLGWFFTHRSETTQRTDLLIFITPEIVQDDERLAERPAERRKQERGLVRVGERWVPASLLDQVNRAGKRLESSVPEVRRQGLVEIAGLVDAERNELVKRADVLTSVLKLDTDVDVKRLAAETLGAIDPARLAAELATLPGNTPVQAVGEVLVPMAVRTPSRSVRQLILANAIKVDRASTVTALMAAVAFGRPFERIVGAEGLALAGDVAATVVLADAIREGKMPLACVAADALGASAGQQSVAALFDALKRRPEPRLEFHLYAALAEAIADDQRLAKEMAQRGLAASARTRELAALEHRERRARFDRILKLYGAPAPGAPEVTGPAEAAAKVRDALRILEEGSPGHRHLLAVALRGIDVLAAARDAAGRPGTAPAPLERVDGGRLKISAAAVEGTPVVHLAHDLVFHAALVDALASAAEAAAAAPFAASPRAEETALREQRLAIEALAGRADFRDVSGFDASVQEALKARGLWAAPQGR